MQRRPCSFRVKPAVACIAMAFSCMSAHAADDSTTTLPEVQVVEKAEHAITQGYVTKRSRTATRTDTELRDIPQSLTVATPELMRDQAVQNLADVVRYTPGVGAAQGEGNRETFIFRGMTTTGDFFIDGVRDDVQYYRDLYNIERVEVLKGPNGMTFGRGGAGGLINRVSKEAGWTDIRQVSLQYGMFDQARGTVDYNQAINDAAAIRINAMYEDGNSYRDGVSLERKAINPTITLKPSDKTKIVLGVEYFKDERTADRGIPSFNGRPVDTKDSTFFGNARQSPTHTEVSAFNALLEHAFDNGLILRNRTRYADYNKFYQNVFAGSAVSNSGTLSLSAYNNATERDSLFNQTDFIYKATTGSVEHELMSGVELSRQVTTNFRETGYFNNSATSTTVSLANPTTNLPVTFRQSTTDADNHTVTTTQAVYFQDQIKFNEQFQAIVGLRYDDFDTDYRNDRLASGAANHKIKTSDDLWAPRAAVIYKPLAALSLYTSYSEAYVPQGGDQLSGLTADNKSFDPEKFKNYEIGAKWDITPELAFTAAVYKLERLNQVTNDPVVTGQFIKIDGQESKGIELGLNGKLTSAWSVAGGYAYQDAEISSQVGANSSSSRILTGTDVGLVPRHSFSLWNRYDINETWGVGLGIISRSEMYAATPTATTSVTLPGYTRLDGAVFAQLDKNLRLQINVENLLNKDYYLYAHNANNITPGAPTLARATLIYNF